MGATAAEKILARAAGKKNVRPNEVIYPEPDVIILHDLHAHLFFRELWEMGLRKLWKPERVMVVIDHRIPAPNVESTRIQNEIRDWVKRYGIRHFYDIGNSGITHQLQIECGLARPGAFIVTKDVHSPNAGAVGSLAIPLVYDIPAFLAAGSSWIRVPETIRINLKGKALNGGCARDVVQASTAKVGFERADYRVIEYGGDYVDALSIDGRQTLCNVVIEVGAKSGIINPDKKACDHVRSITSEPFDPVCSDPDANYAMVLDVDVSSLVPQVAAPPSPDNVIPVSEVEGKPINQAFIGSCAGGMLEDLRIAASVLKNRRVASDVRMFIAPCTQKVYSQASKEGLLDVFVEAGGVILPPGCAVCGGSVAPLADGERAIATMTRNEPGRMGSRNAEIYLSSAATVAASAVAGKITDPRSLMD